MIFNYILSNVHKIEEEINDVKAPSVGKKKSLIKSAASKKGRPWTRAEKLQLRNLLKTEGDFSSAASLLGRPMKDCRDIMKEVNKKK